MSAMCLQPFLLHRVGKKKQKKTVQPEIVSVLDGGPNGRAATSPPIPTKECHIIK